ncbi:MAG TPA: hypothetical protein VGH13_11635 [Xanthobacteraceae bacterium]|jgi:hypothetical protein
MSYFTAQLGEAVRIAEAHLIAARFTRENERHERNKRMAMELKGLKANALAAAANIERLNRAYAAFNAAAPAHAADVEGLTPQITELADDLKFAAQVLGNSVNGSGDSQPKLAVSQNIQPSMGDANAPKPAQEVGQAATFQTGGEAQTTAGS